jgi:predicted ATP-grasp superfamily ATP-dependent carboligase
MAIEELEELLKGKKWSWWGQRAHDALGLSQFIDFDFIACCDWGIDIEDLWNTKVVSLERISGSRTNYSNDDLNNIMNKNLSSALHKKMQKGSNCIMYRSINELEKEASQNKKINLCTPALKLKNFFDDKILFRRILHEIGIKPVPGTVSLSDNLDYNSLKSKFGAAFILKYPFASSGNKTHYVENADNLNYLKNIYQGKTVIIEQYFESSSINVNACITEKENIVSQPSVQIVGIESLVKSRFGYAGNDFAALKNISDDKITEIKKITRIIMNSMVEKGYRGIMGLDFLNTDNYIYPVEINPRFQNSTSMLTLFEIQHDIIPLTFFHINEFTDNESNFRYNYNQAMQFEGAQIILHNLEHGKICIQNPLKPGIYTFSENKLNFIRSGYSILDCRNDEEFALCSGVPQKGTTIQPGAPLVKLHFKKQILNDDLITLKKEIELTIKKIYNDFIGVNNGA